MCLPTMIPAGRGDSCSCDKNKYRHSPWLVHGWSLACWLKNNKLTKLQRGPWLVGEPPPDWGFLCVVRAGMRYARGLCLCPLHAFLIYLKDALHILEGHCRVSQAMYPPPFGVIRYTWSLWTCSLRYYLCSLKEQSESSLRVHINMLMY